MGLLGFVSDLFGGDKAEEGYDQGMATLQGMYNKIRPEYDPYLNLGRSATDRLQNFGESELRKDPGYLFRMNMGNRYARGLANAGGRGFLSGNSLAGMLNFNQNLASQEYGNAYNRLFGQTQLGQKTLADLAQFASGHANNMANLQVGKGGVESSILGNVLNAGATILGGLG